MTDPTGALTPYAELVEVITSLPLLLREGRRARGLSVRKAAIELGCSFSTVSRMEAGEDCALSNAVAVLRWLGDGPRAIDVWDSVAYLMPDLWGGEPKRIEGTVRAIAGDGMVTVEFDQDGLPPMTVVAPAQAFILVRRVPLDRSDTETPASAGAA